jgi:hypothetical protein
VGSVPFGFPLQRRQILGLPGRQTNKSGAHARILTGRSRFVPLFMRTCVARSVRKPGQARSSVPPLWSGSSLPLRGIGSRGRAC